MSGLAPIVVEVDAAPMTVVQALSAVMEDVQAVKKGDRNTQQNYSFRGVDSVVNAVGPALRKHGVIVVPVGAVCESEHYTTAKGTPMKGVTLTVSFRFYGPAGDFIDACVAGEASDTGDKATPKAHSVAYRTLLLQALCIPTDEADPDSESYVRGKGSEGGPAAPPGGGQERSVGRGAFPPSDKGSEGAAANASDRPTRVAAASSPSGKPPSPDAAGGGGTNFTAPAGARGKPDPKVITEEQRQHLHKVAVDHKVPGADVTRLMREVTGDPAMVSKKLPKDKLDAVIAAVQAHNPAAVA
jgi:hypothetical protein